MDGIDLTFEEEAVASIARRAISLKTGARGLRAILEGSMLDLMYDLPTIADEVGEIQITSDFILGEGEARRIKRQRKESA